MVDFNCHLVQNVSKKWQSQYQLEEVMVIVLWLGKDSGKGFGKMNWVDLATFDE